jgi:hypothetical protein
MPVKKITRRNIVSLNRGLKLKCVDARDCPTLKCGDIYTFDVLTGDGLYYLQEIKAGPGGYRQMFFPHRFEVIEKDQSEGQEGAKADTGKVDLTYVMEYFPNAIEYIARVCEFGDVKYTKITGKSARGSWLQVPDGLRRYTAALFRHLFCVFKGIEYDYEPEEYGLPPVLHRAQSAWNNLAILERWARENKTEIETHFAERKKA